MAYWDFLQMNPENMATARNTSWGSALGQDFNPRNPNYQGFRPNPANVAQGSRVGLGSYINQGLNSLRGVFNPGSNVGGATTLMRKMAMSPVAKGIGTVGRVAGLTNPIGAAAMSAYAAPKLIDALTKRDADATETSMFGLNINDLENKAAAYDAGDMNMPGATLNDWGAEGMGPIPVAGDDIQEQITETETLDPSWQHQLELQGINREGIQKPGFFEGIGQKLGMTQVSDADRAANEQFMQEQGIGVDNTGRMTSGDFIGQNLPGKSGWGSANFGEMAQNWLDKFGDVEYSDTVHGRRNKAKQEKIKKAAEDYALKLQEQERIEQDKPVQQPTITGGGDRGTFTGPHPDTPTKSPAEGGWHPGVAQGGYMRSRYNQGGRVGILSVF